MIAVTRIYEFDEFRVDGAQRRLLRDGQVVPLHSKAFDLLLVLVRNAGNDLTKDELLNAVWPGQILEESNLAVNVSAIRRALGENAAQPRSWLPVCRQGAGSRGPAGRRGNRAGNLCAGQRPSRRGPG